jgi:predicted flap endonuclease-1-like 5' DNA nuclease
MRLMWAIVAVLFGVVGVILGVILGIAAASLYYRNRMVRSDAAARVWADMDEPLEPEANEPVPIKLEPTEPEVIEPTLDAPEPDDLKRIVGIGKVFEGRLNKAGVTTFAKLASLTPDEISAKVEIGLDSTRIVDDDWIGQAVELAK